MIKNNTNILPWVSLFFCLFLLVSLKGLAQKHSKTPLIYPNLDSTYSQSQLEQFIKIYSQKKDTLGLAFTYGAYVNAETLPYSKSIELFTNIINTLAYVSEVSQLDYHKILLKSTTFYSSDKYSYNKSLAIVKKVIDFAKNSQSELLEIDAIIYKLHLQTQFNTSNDNDLAFDEEIKRLAFLIKRNRFDLRWQVIYYNYMGELYLKQKRFDTAITNFSRSLTLAQKSENTIFEALNRLYLAKVYRIKGQYSVTQKYLNEVEFILKKLNYNGFYQWKEEERAFLEEALSNYKSATYHWKKYYDFNKLVNKEAKQDIDFGSLKMDFFEKQIAHENEKLALKNKITENENLVKSRTLSTLFLLLGLLILSIGFVAIWSQQKIKLLAKEALIAELKGQEEERKHIAEQLHDQLGGTLLGIKAQMSATIPNYDLLVTNLDFVYNSIRATSHILANDAVLEVGLVQACHDFINLIDEKKTIKFNHSGKNLNELPISYAQNSFRFIQELLINALKYANANLICLEIGLSDQHFLISVEDNGLGFDLNQKSKGIGLKNIKNRIKLLKGNLEIITAPNKGTTVLIDIPMR